jgi:hypothetical protein
MWGEALKTAAYLTNRSPTKAVPKLPAVMWTGKEQDMSIVQLFGSKVYAKVTTYLKKLDSRAIEAVMVGYAPNGYRLWNPKTNKIFLSRDVMFTNELYFKNDTPDGEITITWDTDDKEDTTNREELEGEDQAIPEPFNEDAINENLAEDIAEHVPEIRNNIENPDHEENNNQGYHLRDRQQLKRPARFQDYEMYLCENEEALLTFAECSTDYKWKQAIEEEKDSLIKNQAWTLVDKSHAAGKQIITSRWIFKVKDDGTHKARLVARGCEQRGNSVDYKDTFSPVVDTTSLRVLLALAAQKNMNIKSFDVKTAFLNGYLDQEVYMYVPEGFDDQTKICQLKRALYGLKQSPLRWYKRLSTFLKEKGLHQLKSDHCIFKNSDGSMYLAIHVDDGILMGTDIKAMFKLLEELTTEFEIKIDQNPKSYLGMEITKTEGGLILSQTNYANKILHKYGMAECRTALTPLDNASKQNQELNHMPGSKPYPYREVLGSLQYLACKTRPDLAFAVNFAQRFTEHPSPKNINDVKQILRYVKGTVKAGLLFSTTPTDQLTIEAYSDSDYAGSGPEGQMKSTSGYVICFANGPIAWGSHKQSIVATSTTEAEFIAAAECVKEIQYLKTLLSELTGVNFPACLNVDNQSAIKLVKSGKMNRRSKHINVRYYFISEALDNGLFTLKYCPSAEQTADILTKPLLSEKFKKHRNSLLTQL